MKFRHPYWKELNHQLTERNYEFDCIASDIEEKIYQWKKPIFDQTYQYICLYGTYSSEYDNAICCDLGVSSPYMVELFNRIGLPECYEQENSLVANVNSDFVSIRIFSVALHWLCLNADQPLQQLDWPVSKDNAAQNVKLLLQHVDIYWPRILNAVNTELKLIAFLNDIDNYPKKTYAKGPISDDPDVYSAFYLLKLGKIKEAMEIIESSYDKQKNIDYQRLSYNPKALNESNIVLNKIYAKYREEINRHI